MTSNTPETNQADKPADSRRQSHAPSFAKVMDGRKQPIRGLWVRNGRYYAQVKLENPITGVKKVRRVPLVDKDSEPVQTVAQARAEMERIRTQRADNALPVLGRQPKFADYAKRFLEELEGARKPGTVEKLKTALARWTEALRGLRVDQVKRVHVNRFIALRLKEQDENGNRLASNRTINLDIIGLRVVMKKALEEGLIQQLPTAGLRPLKTTEVKRDLFTSADLDAICKAAFETKKDKKGNTVPVTANAQEFVDYMKLMAYSGARRNEALGLQWDDVDTDKGQLHIRRQVTHRGIEDLKNHEERTVDFNPKLKAHLEDMASRLQPDSEWLFPSPQRGQKDIPAKSFRDSLILARNKARMPHVGFHDCRHHFISMSVMSGIDFMTIAAWVGHQDGGVLIGKVYGHLANEHRKAMAEKLNFGPTILPAAVNE